MKMILAALTVLMMTGCSLFHSRVEPPEYKKLDLTFRLQEDLIFDGSVVHGKASWGDDWCIITVDPDNYSLNTLGHELRHCLEGHWHD